MRTRSKLLSFIVITIIILGIAESFSLALPVMAYTSTEPHDANAMWFEPSTIELNSSEITVGHKLNVTIWANSSLETKGWQFWLVYANTYINVTKAGYTAGTKSEFLQAITTIGLSPNIRVNFNATHNRVDFGEAWLMGPYREPGFGSLCWIEFEVINLPPEDQTVDIPLDVAYAYELMDPPQTYLLYSDDTKRPLNVYNGLIRFVGEEPQPTQYTLTVTWDSIKGQCDTIGGVYDEGIEVTVTATAEIGYEFAEWKINGSPGGTDNPIIVVMDRNIVLEALFNAIPPEGTRIFVDPAEIIDPTLLPSSTFSVNITVDDVADLKACWFNLSYSTDIIGWIGITLFRVENQPPRAVAIMDDDIGFIWVNLTFGTPLTALEPTPLLKLDFHVETLGGSLLDLHDTGLLDSNGNLLDHISEDGFFLTLIRDVAVTDVVPDQNWVYQGWTMNISVTVLNKGNISETFIVEAYYDDIIIGNSTVADLLPGDETTIKIPWNTQAVTACANYTISAKIPPVTYELNIIDNEFVDGEVEIRLFCDLTGDGSVSIDDLVLASESFGTSPGYVRWNEYADVNRDDYVGIDDIVIIADNFGEIC